MFSLYKTVQWWLREVKRGTKMYFFSSLSFTPTCYSQNKREKNALNIYTRCSSSLSTGCPPACFLTPAFGFIVLRLLLTQSQHLLLCVHVHACCGYKHFLSNDVINSISWIQATVYVVLVLQYLSGSFHVLQQVRTFINPLPVPLDQGSQLMGHAQNWPRAKH